MILRGKLNEFQSKVEAYLGMLNQLKVGLNVAEEERVEKPPELKKYEQTLALGLPVWQGGLQDQPHIWLEQVGIMRALLAVFQVADKTSSEKKDA